MNTVGESDESEEASISIEVPVTIPGVPQDVEAVAAGDTITVTWGEVTGAISYNVYWSTTAGVTKENGTEITDVTSPYQHEGLTAGETYYYVVTAVNSAGESDESDEISALLVPGIPQNVDATVADEDITVTWDDVDGATSYNIYWSTTVGVTKETGTKITDVESPYQHEGPPAHETYYYVVTAENDTGEGDASDEASTFLDYPLLKMFVTSATGTGALFNWVIDGWYPTQGNIEAGDEICQHLATTAGLNGTFKAWLSDDTTDAYCHIHNLTGQKDTNCGEDTLPATAGPWMRTDGQPFGEKIDQALNPNYKVYTPPQYDELGNKIATGYSFTGTTSEGKNADNHCNRWTGEDGDGRVGRINVTSGEWIGGAGLEACNSQQHLYCFQVVQGRDLPSFDSPGKIVFVTSVSGTGDLHGWPQSDGESGLLAGDSICNLIAHDDAHLEGTFVAWLSSSTTDAKDRITSDGPWVRMDGVVVAENKAQLISGTLNAPINQDEFENYLDTSEVWTGTYENGVKIVDTCNDWTDGSDTLNSWGGRNTAINDAWTQAAFSSCDQIKHIYCFEN